MVVMFLGVTIIIVRVSSKLTDMTFEKDGQKWAEQYKVTEEAKKKLPTVDFQFHPFTLIYREFKISKMLLL